MRALVLYTDTRPFATVVAAGELLGERKGFVPMLHSTARTAAVIYAVIAFALVALNVVAMLSDPSPPWRKVITLSAIAIAAPLVPYAGLRLGTWLAHTDHGRGIAAWGAIAAVAVAAAVMVAILLSAEPLAALALLYVPPLQVLCALAALALIWITGRV